MKTREFERYLRDSGCEFHRQCGNSHAMYIRGGAKASVPTNHKMMAPGTIRSVCRALGIDNPMN